ncbi:hypothetical protein EJ06DRAFT_489062 [Trichodelitschia bisporula]|uniref:CoA-dependent acyltransferase n=1 Tax=Trichodelitschia bisporula TaxID=703511 RepID=A0A6G1I7N9_9PEZI|nr:hypothetical protein EJ06DRAFT_489062 [Trichodelitschia bisporula]
MMGKDLESWEVVGYGSYGDTEEQQSSPQQPSLPHDSPHWLHRYAAGYHAWRRDTASDRLVFTRPLGLVENSFDIDGRYYGGRADFHCMLDVDVRTSLSDEEFQKRIVLAWAALCLQHPLMLARIHHDPKLMAQFVVNVPKDESEALAVAQHTLTFLKIPWPYTHDLLLHVANARRVIDPAVGVTRLFVEPLRRDPEEPEYAYLSMVQVCGHSVTDGLSTYNRMSHLIDLLNEPEDSLRATISQRIANFSASSLPPAQEDLYPRPSGSLARQRWFWVLTLIRRHVRPPLPFGFPNPLRRHHDLPPLVPKYPLDYTPEHAPPLRSCHDSIIIPVHFAIYLKFLCRTAGTSIGAGCFALVALVMMELEEAKHPDTPASERAPFVASFPLNPRPFFNYDGPHDSCMLSFSDGIVFPFLSADLNVSGRLRLLARTANRGLRKFQKRPGVDATDFPRLLAGNYVTAIQRVEDKLPPELRGGESPQGPYSAYIPFNRATCGVSSIGSVARWVQRDKYSLDGKGDFEAKFRLLGTGVRARDGEFLVSAAGLEDGDFKFSVSYDASSIGYEEVEEWKRRMRSVLEDVGKDLLQVHELNEIMLKAHWGYDFEK